jgi:hypothetical protein
VVPRRRLHLRALNEAAVSGHRLRPHDDVAVMADKGVAGVYALHLGAAQLIDAGRAVWCGKPAGVSSDEFLGLHGGRKSLWQRQMVLGPTPEFCSVDDDDPLTGAVIVDCIRQVGASSS